MIWATGVGAALSVLGLLLAYLVGLAALPLITLASGLAVLLLVATLSAFRGTAVLRDFSDPMFRRRLRWEIDRCRRHGRCFSLVLLPTRHAGQTQRTLRALESELRSIDSVDVGPHGVMALLPETDRSAARAVVERTTALLPAEIDGTHTSVATFPDDGVTVGALMDVLGSGSPRPRGARS